MTEVRLDGEPVATITRWHYTGVFELCLPGRHHSTRGCFGTSRTKPSGCSPEPQRLPGRHQDRTAAMHDP
jgi:hypothetical protein